MDDLANLNEEWDGIIQQEDDLKDEKDKLRKKLDAAYVERIEEEMPYEDHPENVSYTYVHPSTGLIYKRVIVEPTVVDIEGLQRDHVDIADAVIEKKTVYTFSERKALKLARKDVNAYRILQDYVKPGKTSVRLYKGREPKEDDE